MKKHNTFKIIRVVLAVLIMIAALGAFSGAVPWIAPILQRHSGIRNATAEWFGKSFEKQNIVGSYNLIYNAALMVKGGLGCALVMDKLADVEAVSCLCFRPLEPRLETGLDIVWKKYQVFSPAAKLFQERIREQFEK